MRQISSGERETVEKGEPGCRGALPGICVVHAFLPGGSKPGKGRARTHMHLNCTQTYTIIPKGKTYIEHKSILYTRALDT